MEDTTIEMLTGVVLLAPLVSFLICLTVPVRYSWIVPIIATLILFTSASVSVYIFFATPAQSILIPIEWFSIAQFSFNGNIELNRLSVLMLPIVTLISFLVHLYSIGYMAGERGTKRYFSLLGFFTFSMLGIVLSDNLLLIFIFWELVGFSSYILIGHWLEKPAAARAAQKAFLFNRIGDAGFLIGIMIVWTNTQTLNLQEILHMPVLYSWQTAASLCIFCGVIGKSAQFPLLTWLPDAMEGPTPVSALIHAATMVAAGVFLLSRVFSLFTDTALNVVAIVGAVTAFIAAISALNQFDIKRILAYSTISQLGLMVTAVGVGSADAAMLHLTTHAFFKACLFLGAGSIIYSVQLANRTNENFDAQDIRNLGGLKNKLPYTFFTFTIAAASLAGIPLFSGFLSKDSIITVIWSWSGNGFSWQWIILVMILVTSFVTVLYTFRMVWFIFFNTESQSTHETKESPWIMRVPLVVLASFSVWFFVSVNPFNPEGWFTQFIGNIEHSTLVASISIGLIIAALGTAWFLFSSKKSSNPSKFLQEGFNLDLFYEKIIGQSTLRLAAAAETTDRKWIDGFLHLVAFAQVSFAHVIVWFDKYIVDGTVNGVAWMAGASGTFTRSFQGGKIQLYIFWAVAGLIIFLFFVLI